MTKLCPRGKAAAKRKFKVYPSAYANAYASKICAGKIKDPSGTKRKDFRGPKPAGAKKGALMIIIGVGKKKKVDKKKFGGVAEKMRAYALAQKMKDKDRLTESDVDKAKRLFSPRQKASDISKRVIKGAKDFRSAYNRDKAKVQKKMGGGMTAGSQSAMGRLQKARMMNKGGMADYYKDLM
jgi:hypothetical protein